MKLNGNTVYFACRSVAVQLNSMEMKPAAFYCSCSVKNIWHGEDERCWWNHPV